MPEWRAIFAPGRTGETALITAYLTDRLKEPNTFTAGRRTVTIISPTRDDVFQTGQWLRHNNPLGLPLKYTVVGYDDEKRVIYRSACKKCRADPKGVDAHQLHRQSRHV